MTTAHALSPAQKRKQTKQQILDLIKQVDDVHQDGHVVDPETNEVHSVPSLAMDAGVGHEAILHEGQNDPEMAFCPGCHVISRLNQIRTLLEDL